ncbi:hypothetical protein KIPE111705_05610 [Kibdelosporangium persicum]|uniref:hypothetical protein n=1 Tax=Kibdelosporangium persicum TaxID=2698649 RepID=UPI001563ADEB|nr:hypothetical protein [Kibdelosporangium persicum]
MTLHLFDTQLVSYAINKGRDLPSLDVAISSTTAQELLLIQSPEPTRNNYYIPTSPSSLRAGRLLNIIRKASRSWPGNRRATMAMHQTDRLILNFGRDYPAVVEYSHQAVASALNRGDFGLLEHMARALEPARHRVVVRRLHFLLDHKVRCVPLGQTSCETGLHLFQAFALNFALKNNFRNSLNDILTLAVAQTSSAFLHTDDELLGRFARLHSAVPVNRVEEGISIDFTSPTVPRRTNRGTKGYVNHGWRVRTYRRAH